MELLDPPSHLVLQCGGRPINLRTNNGLREVTYCSVPRTGMTGGRTREPSAHGDCVVRKTYIYGPRDHQDMPYKSDTPILPEAVYISNVTRLSITRSPCNSSPPLSLRHAAILPSHSLPLHVILAKRQSSMGSPTTFHQSQSLL